MIKKRDIIASLSVIAGFVVLASYGLFFEYLRPFSFLMFLICGILIVTIPVREFFVDEFNHETMLISINLYAVVLFLMQLVELSDGADNGAGILSVPIVWISFRMLIKKFSRQIDDFYERINIHSN